MTQQLNGPFISPAAGQARQMVMFLHGYGANGQDLLSVGEEWQEHLPEAVFIAPNAPEVCEAWAAGYQWFSLREKLETISLNNLIDRAGRIDAPAQLLSAYIDQQLKHWGIEDKNLAVVGFSQGAMMAMYTMPRRAKSCAGIIGYSGMLIGAAGLKASGISKAPVLAIHGDADDVVPPESLVEVDQGFRAAGFDVEAILRPRLGHGIDEFGLARGLEFLKSAFR